MIAIGIFLHQYADRIIENYELNKRKLVFLILIGEVLSVLQIMTLGKAETPIGSLIMMAAIMLLALMKPEVNVNYKVVSVLKKISTPMYIIHLLLDKIFKAAFPDYSFLWEKSGFCGGYLYPLLMLVICIAVCTVYVLIKSMIKKVHHSHLAK